MSSSETTSHESQHANSSPLCMPAKQQNKRNTNQADWNGDTLAVPQPTRPPMSDRQHSTHIYAVNQQHHQPLAGRLSTPEQAPMEEGQSEFVPTGAIIMVRPSIGLQRSDTDYSTSSGITVNEAELPQAMLDTAQARGPGTYRLALGTSRLGSTVQSLDAADLERAVDIDYDVQSLDRYKEKIASKEYLDELVQTHTLPAVTGPQWWNRLRHGIFSTYRRLFALALLGNLIALLYCIWLNTHDLYSISHNNAATAVGANLFVAVLMRHEHWVNFLFRLFVAMPHSFPVGVRRLAAKVYSYGGVHSACGISGLAWYIYFTSLFFLQIDATIDAKLGAVAGLSAVMLLLLSTLVIMSYPTLRSKFHDQWEMIHRFFGWTAIGIIWTQIILIACSNAEYSDLSVGHFLLVTPAFWFLIAITLLIIYPWLRLRRVRYSTEQLSSHAIRLWFSDKRILPTTVGIKLSTSPLMENHSFATIPNSSNRPGFSVLVSNNGDWTKQLINNPPAYLWARGACTIGVMRVALLFKPLVIVATGSGIGPCLSFLNVHPNWPVRVVWSARFPEATYGKGVMESVFRADPDAVVIDTKKTGKPDLMGIVHAVYEEMKAEAVVIISNPFATKEVVYELETRNVPAFGAIFDS